MRKEAIVITMNGTYDLSFMTQIILRNGRLSHGGDHKIFKVMTST